MSSVSFTVGKLVDFFPIIVNAQKALTRIEYIYFVTLYLIYNKLLCP